MSFNNINRNDKKWQPEQADKINNIVNRITENVNKLEVPDLERKATVNKIIVNGAINNSSIKIDSIVILRFSFTDASKIDIPMVKGCIFDVYLKAYNSNGQYEIFRLNKGKLKQISNYNTVGPYYVKIEIIN